LLADELGLDLADDEGEELHAVAVENRGSFDDRFGVVMA
jgi:hypothetical protein